MVEGFNKEPPMQGNIDLPNLHGGKFAAWTSHLNMLGRKKLV